MTEPRLYGRYDRSEAVTLFGSEAEARSLCDGQWVVFPDVVLCLAGVGGPPRHSHFGNGSSFCWVADKPYRVNDDGHARFLPREVVGPQAEVRKIHLFVRGAGSGRYLYVGEVGPSHRYGFSGYDSHGEASFDLRPTLPSGVWAVVGGFRPGDPDHAAVDAALDRLRSPIGVEERLGVLRQLVEYWHGPIRPEDGFGEKDLEGLVFPYPLRCWYRWAGRRTKVMSGQNTLLGPCEVIIRDDLLVFYGENQWCYEWATLFEGDDPPVFGRSEATDPWEPEGITLSEHLILACLFEGVMAHSPYGASASWLGASALDGIIEHIPPSPSARGGGAVRAGSTPRAGPSCSRCRTARSTGRRATRSGSGPSPSTLSDSSSRLSTIIGSTPPCEGRGNRSIRKGVRTAGPCLFVPLHGVRNTPEPGVQNGTSRRKPCPRITGYNARFLANAAVGE